MMPVAIIIGALIIGAAIYIAYVANKDANAVAKPSAAGKKVENMQPVAADDWILGSPNAAIVIVEYSDFECPYCRQFHQTLHRLVDEHGKSEEVAWVFRHFPIAQLHKKAATEALAAECAGSIGGNEAFWKYADLLFSSGKGNDTLDLSILPTLAQAVGIDQTKFGNCMEGKYLMSRVEAEFKDAVAAGGSGTPYSILVVDGKRYPISGAQPYPAMKAIIQSILVHRGATEITAPSDTTPDKTSPTLPPVETASTTP